MSDQPIGEGQRSVTETAAKIPVSVVISAKDEERNMAKCLRTLTDFGEVFVVDSHSTDRTREIAEAMGAKVVEFTWNGRYPKKKQWGIENLPLTYEWMLHVDADEEVYPELVEEIRALMERGPEHDGYYISFDYVFSGKVLKHGLRSHKLVLFRHKLCRFLEYDDLAVPSTAEIEVHHQPQITGTIGKLNGRMLHDDHKGFYHYFARHNRYSDWEAITRLNGTMGHPDESRLLRHRLMKRGFDLIPLKPFVIFGYSYIIQRGFLDGRAGFRFALAMMFYFWQIGIKMDEMKRQQPELATGRSARKRPVST